MLSLLALRDAQITAGLADSSTNVHDDDRTAVLLSVAASPVCVDDKSEVEEYFNNEGFNRWNRIYSEDGEVNKVQLDIRTGHAETVDKVLGWVDADGTAKLALEHNKSGTSFAFSAAKPPQVRNGTAHTPHERSDSMLPPPRPPREHCRRRWRRH